MSHPQWSTDRMSLAPKPYDVLSDRLEVFEKVCAQLNRTAIDQQAQIAGIVAELKRTGIIPARSTSGHRI